ncbi:MAG TPA: D-alanyl-D-alanine carboxypeptidase [Blastocatellia bacterium]|nr:D-alanyl-D-alanine carboxypeptidase [Blastocatellia bacterium]
MLITTGCRESKPVQTVTVAAPVTLPPRPPLQAVSEYKDTLASQGINLGDHGILIETLDGGQILGEHNADVTFNPASVMKLATSLVALRQFTPDYRYRTDFLAGGTIDHARRTLEGDLVVYGNFDPMFSLTDAQQVATELSRLGIARVTGSLRIAGGFYYFATGYKSNLSRETSAAKLRAALTGAGIRIDGATVFGEKSGALLVSHYSEPLMRLLLYQNAHSSNAVAEVIGESLGGAEAVQNFLENELGIENHEIFVGRTSGLQFNRITPRASLKVLRKLLETLDAYGIKPEDVMPIAGIDSGTLRTRLYAPEVRGSVIAKTGTLSSTDRGVSTLVGIACTRNDGPLLFAIFNSDGGVFGYRRLQDEFVEKIIAEAGGPAPVSRTEDALADQARNTIVQVLYKKTPQYTEMAAH